MADQLSQDLKNREEEQKEWERNLRTQQMNNTPNVRPVNIPPTLSESQREQGEKQNAGVNEIENQQRGENEETAAGLAGNYPAIEQYEKTKGERDQLRDRLGDSEQGYAQRQLTRLKLLQKNIQLAKQSKEAAKAYAQAGSKKATANILKQAWLNLIDSFGLTLIYINFHFVMAYMGGPLSDFFCKFGEEWIPAVKMNEANSKGEEGKKALERATIPVQLVEILIMFGVDIIILLLTLIIVTLIILIFDFIENPTHWGGQGIKFAITAGWSWLTSWFKK